MNFACRNSHCLISGSVCILGRRRKLELAHLFILRKKATNGQFGGRITSTQGKQNTLS